MAQTWTDIHIHTEVHRLVDMEWSLSVDRDSQDSWDSVVTATPTAMVGTGAATATAMGAGAVTALDRRTELAAGLETDRLTG